MRRLNWHLCCNTIRITAINKNNYDGYTTVKLDEETEQVLSEIKQLTRLSISHALKQGLFTFRNEVCRKGSARPFDIYKGLDLGGGGYAIAPSTDSKRGLQEAIKRKLNR